MTGAEAARASLHGSRLSALPLPPPAARSSLCVPEQLGLSGGSNPPTLSPSGRGLFVFWDCFVRAGLHECTPLESSVSAQSLGNHLWLSHLLTKLIPTHFLFVHVIWGF